MVLMSELVIRYAAQGHQQVLDAERRVRTSISETARTAAKESGVTKQWMERNKAALAGIGLAAGGAMAAIISQTPDLVAGLSETQLWFSMFAQTMGQEWSPALDWFNGLLEDALGWFEALPGPVKVLVSWIALIVLGLLIAIPTIALFVWSLGTIAAALGGLTFVTAAGGLTLLGIAVGVLAGLVLGGAVVWLLWQTGVLKAVEEAGAYVGQFAYNAGVVFGNLKDNLVEWFTLVAQSAGLWGAEFALNWVDGIVSNIPFLGDLLGPKIDSMKTVLDTAGADLQAKWAEWNSSGGFSDGLMEGVVTPSWQNDPSQMAHPVTDWLDGLLGGTAGDGGQSDRLNDLMPSMPDFAMPPGYSEATEQLRDLEQQAADLDATAATTSTNVSASMSTMAANTSTSSQLLSTATETAATGTSGTFDTLVGKAPKWGSDLMGLFVTGVNSKYGGLISALTRIRSAIESALSFDIVANDRMAERWGSDFVQHFNAGLAAQPLTLPEMPEPPKVSRVIDTTLGAVPEMPPTPALSTTLDMVLGAAPDLPDISPTTRIVDMILGAVPEIPRISATIDAMFSAIPEFSFAQASPMGAAAPMAPAAIPAPIVGSAPAAPTRQEIITVTLESGAIQITGSKADNLNERALRQIVRDEIPAALRNRGR